jgi:hypothetical protein
MSISITQGNADLDAIASGGPEFMARLRTFQESKAGFEKALADLNLGKAAQEAYDDAKRILDAAKAQADMIIKAAEAKAAKADEMMARADAHKTKLYEDLRQLGVNVQKAAAG